MPKLTWFVPVGSLHRWLRRQHSHRRVLQPNLSAVNGWYFQSSASTVRKPFLCDTANTLAYWDYTPEHTSASSPKVLVANTRVVEGKEAYLRDKEAKRLSYRVARRRKSHVFARKHRECPSINSDILRHVGQAFRRGRGQQTKDAAKPAPGTTLSARGAPSVPGRSVGRQQVRRSDTGLTVSSDLGGPYCCRAE